jgi:hypothetical protein
MTEEQATRFLIALDAFLEARENKRNNAAEATRWKYQQEWSTAAQELARALLPVGEAQPPEHSEASTRATTRAAPPRER